MRGTWLAGAGVFVALLAGCGSSSPTQAQVAALKQWFSDDSTVVEAQAVPFQLVRTIPGQVDGIGQMANAAMLGLDAPRMPVASLEDLWRSYLLDLRGVAQQCSEDNGTITGASKQRARAAATEFVELADRLPEEIHRLPKG